MKIIKRDLFNSCITILLIVSAILGGTSFGAAQVAGEVLLWLMLSYGIIKIRLTKSDVAILAIFIFTSSVSAILNDFRVFALNFKIFGLCLLTFIYFRRVSWNPIRIINVALIVNVTLIVHQYVTGSFIITSPSFFVEYYRNSVWQRPIGLFLTPHASVTFIVLHIIYLVEARERYFSSFVLFIVALMTSSLTAIVAFVLQIANYLAEKPKYLRFMTSTSNQVIGIVVLMLLLYMFRTDFVELLKMESYFRYYSVEIMLQQLFDPIYFYGIATPYPTGYADYIAAQEHFVGILGNEIGLVKVFVEGGIILGGLTLFVLLRELRAFRIFIIVSLLHYSFVINMPFMLFLMIVYNRSIIDKLKGSVEGLEGGKRFRGSFARSGRRKHPDRQDPRLGSIA